MISSFMSLISQWFQHTCIRN